MQRWKRARFHLTPVRPTDNPVLGMYGRPMRTIDRIQQELVFHKARVDPSPLETERVGVDSSSRPIDPRGLRSTVEKGAAVLLIDVRRKDEYNADPQMIPKAEWKDPNLVRQWTDELPKDKKVIVYRVRSGSVSNAVFGHLLARNVKACYIQGEMTAWKDQGGPLVKKTNR